MFHISTPKKVWRIFITISRIYNRIAKRVLLYRETHWKTRKGLVRRGWASRLFINIAWIQLRLLQLPESSSTFSRTRTMHNRKTHLTGHQFGCVVLRITLRCWTGCLHKNHMQRIERQWLDPIFKFRLRNCPWLLVISIRSQKNAVLIQKVQWDRLVVHISVRQHNLANSSSNQKSSETFQIARIVHIRNPPTLILRTAKVKVHTINNKITNRGLIIQILRPTACWTSQI